jgi:hypothetical protein
MPAGQATTASAAGRATVSIPSIRKAGSPPHAQQGTKGAMVFTDNKQPMYNEQTRSLKKNYG